MSVQSKVLEILQSAEAPLSARTIQNMATQDTDPSARNVRRTIRRLKDLGHPIYSGADGHLYLGDDMAIDLTDAGRAALRGRARHSGRPVAQPKCFA